MTMLMSPVPKIDNLWLDHLPAGKVVNVAKVVRVDRTTIFITDQGKLYNAGQNNYCYTLGSESVSAPIVKALHKLGAITAKQRDDHLKAASTAAERQRKRWAAESVIKDSAKAGIKLTKAQLAKLKSAGAKVSP